MARKVIGGTAVPKKETKDKDTIKLLESLKDYKPNKVVLFKSKASNLTSAQKQYVKCATILKNVLTSEKKLTDFSEVGIGTVCSFFAVHYRNCFDMDCPGYNIFNSKQVFANVKKLLNFKSNNELLLFLAYSTVRFDRACIVLNLSSNVLTMSTFKQPWILDELALDSNSSKRNSFEGFY